MLKEYSTTIIVNQKPEFSDPKAQKLQEKLAESGVVVKSVKIGKRFEIKQQGETIYQATQKAKDMTEALLVNPVVEEATEIVIKEKK